MYWTIITQKVYSRLFCENIDTPLEDANYTVTNTSKIKLYKIKLPDYFHLVERFKIYLNEIELNRSQKYHFDKDRNRFIICRALLKISLADHVGISVDKIVIAIDAHKKPYLPSHPNVFFNVSHTHKYALIAIGKTLVGVDIEKIDWDYDYSEAVTTVFNSTDRHKLGLAIDKKHTFFKYWTRKEAIVKATGKGIGDNFKQIPASDGMHTLPPELLSNVQNLSVLSFDIDKEYLASVAIEGVASDFKTLHFSKLPLILGKV